ncbi:hypothetical protein OAF54_00995 [bacterium]|nr:hypothetical protein [bacterium]
MLKGRIASQASLEMALKRISEIDFSKPHTYKIEPEEDSFTSSQIRLFWKWMGEIEEQTGYGKNDLGFEMKERYLPSIQRTLMNNESVNERKSLTKLKKKEMAEFMEAVFRFWTIEMGFSLFHPQDQQRRV